MSGQMVTGEIDGVAYRKTARNAPTLLIEIETDRAGTWGLCEEAIAGPYPRGGVKQTHRQQLVIYEHELPEVQKLVRTDAHEALYAAALASAPQTRPERATNSLGEALRLAREALAIAEQKRVGVSQAASKVADCESEIAREAIRRLCTNPGLQDGLPPLLSVRVIKKGPPPSTPENMLANQHGDLAAVLRQLLAERDEPKSRKTEPKS